MKLKNIHINGFGTLRNRTFELNPGLNIFYGENEKGKTTFISFITAVFCGFRGESSLDSSDGLPERNRYIPWTPGTFGGNITFENQGEDYSVVAIWGGTPKDDHVEIYYPDGTANLLRPGETVCERILGITPLQFDVFAKGNFTGNPSAALKNLNSFLSDSEELPRTAPKSDACLFHSGEAQEAIESALLHYRNDEGTGVLDLEENKLNSLENQLTHIASMEENIMALSERLPGLKERTGQLKSENEKALTFEDVRTAAALVDRRDRANGLFEEINQLDDAYKKETKRLKKRKIPWIILISLILLADILAIALTFLPEGTLPFRQLDPFIAKTHEMMPLSAIIGFGALLLFVVLLIVVCTCNRSRQYALADEITYKEQNLSDILGIDRKTAGEEGWEQNAKLSLEELTKECNLATDDIAVAGREHTETQKRKEELISLGNELSDVNGKISLLRKELASRPSYTRVESQIAEEKDKYKNLCFKYNALTVALSMMKSVRRKLAGNFREEFESSTGSYLDILTGGKRSSAELTQEYGVTVLDGGTLRSVRYFNGCARSQISLAMSMTEGKMLSAHASPLPLISDELLSGYDTSNRDRAIPALMNYASEINRQIIMTSSDESVKASGYIREDTVSEI